MWFMGWSKNTFLVFFLMGILFCFSKSNAQNTETIPDEVICKNAWVDSVFNSLTAQEKIAQLFVVRANQPNKKYSDEVTKLIKEQNIGGVTFFGSTPYKQLKQTNAWQELAKTPLFISIDGEWGLGMRLDSVLDFPMQMTLGAIENDSLIYEMGELVAQQCLRMGIQINFAPVVDVNVNPKNPVINMRSFGESPDNVARKGTAYMSALRDNGIIATAKHFPGHGDTDSDSHQTLPIVNHDRARLDSIELYPFKKLIEAGAEGIMVAHLYCPTIEDRANTATTLSNKTITGLLKNELGFNGLIVTDALDMKGVTKYFPPGQIEIKALKAGNDLLLLPQDCKKAIKSIQKEIKNGNITQETIDEKCKKILGCKYKSGLNQNQSFATSGLNTDLNNPESEHLIRKLYAHATTLVKNENDLIPLKNIDTLKIATVVIGKKIEIEFQKSLNRYTKTKNFQLSKYFSPEDEIRLIKNLEGCNLVIVSVNNTNINASQRFGLTQRSINLIQKIAEKKTLVLDLFANPYALAFFDSTTNINAILVSYQDNKNAQAVSAQIIMGGIGAKGKLPVTASEEFPINTGFQTQKSRLEFSDPNEFQITKQALAKIDSIAKHGIEIKAYPGCQIMAIKNGKVFYDKSFGFHTYDNKKQVQNDDVYDLASITKIAATTLAIMKLYDDGKIDIDQKLQVYLPFLKGTEKGKIVIRNLMSHQAALQAWIPYYLFTVDKNGNLDTTIYQKNISEEFPIRVAENIYIKKNYTFTLFDSLVSSAQRENHDYKYSDLGFYLLMKLVENVSNQAFEDYVDRNFYQALALPTITFLPLHKIAKEKIVPTENDQSFRQQLLRGDVHDPGAAMLGGICGHAGLFSNATDLAVIMQMLLQDGNYGGQQFLDSASIKEFTSCQFPINMNRRGIGFDKPLLIFEKDRSNCKSASPSSFGHSGFTGTYIWADPQENLIYVFLSNRVYPDADNPKIMNENIRTNIHQAIYEALNPNKKNE
jgi:beta-N-acetylhexosaminidase